MKRILVVLGVLLFAAMVTFFFITKWSPVLLLFSLALIFMCLHYVFVKKELKAAKGFHENFSNDKNFRLFRRKVTLSGLVLITTVFLISLRVLFIYQQPNGTSPYFNNTDHYAVRNDGVAFDDRLVLYNNRSGGQGLWKSESGIMSIQEQNGRFFLLSDHVFEPVFLKEKEAYSIINPIYTQAISTGMVVEGIGARLVVNKVIKGSGSKEHFWTIGFRFEQVNSINPLVEPLVCEFAIKKTIRKGIALLNLIEDDAEKWDNEMARGALLTWLSQVGDILLVNKVSNNESELLFFPTAKAWNNKLRVMQNQPIEIKMVREAELQPDMSFFIGLSRKAEYRVSSFEDSVKVIVGKSNKFSFVQAGYFALSTKHEDEPLGTPQIRFIKNNYSQVGSSDYNEGFLFHDEMRHHADNRFNGIIEYTVLPTGCALDANIVDMNLQARPRIHGNGEFCLSGEKQKIIWLFSLRDFSNNVYASKNLVLFLSIIYLAFVVLLVFAPSARLSPIETGVYIFVYCLLFFRFLLLWRIATFPPLSGIDIRELENTIISYDYGESFGIPLTSIAPLVLVVIVGLYRTLRLKRHNTTAFLLRIDNGNYKGFTYRYRYPIIQLAISLFSWLTFEFVPIERLERFTGFFIPVIGWLFVTYRQTLIGDKFYYSFPKYRFALVRGVYNFLAYWIESPIWFTSLITLIFITAADSGFGILFLFVLILRSVIMSFNRKKAVPQEGVGNYLKPQHYRIYGLMLLTVYIWIIADKSVFHVLLENKGHLITLISCLGVISSLILIRQKHIRYSFAIVFGVGLVVMLIPNSSDYINTKINDKLRNTIYRTSIIYQGADKLIKEYGYKSRKETKIIETAQNQWFINSYLQKAFDNGKPINLRPHFSKGVGYTTQTRDVVLPRYVISEFGNGVMITLLLLFFTPLILYLITYKISRGSDGIIAADGYKSTTAVIFLTTLALFVWLTSTNRFVFFGQDFPFLSLTSKMSLLLPFVLLLVFLTDNPLYQDYLSKADIKPEVTDKMMKLRIARWGLGGGLLVMAIVISGRSHFLSEDKFDINLGSTKELIERDLNSLILSYQEDDGDYSNATREYLSYKKSRNGVPQRLDTLFSRLLDDERFNSLYDASTTYDKSLLDRIRNNPSSLFSASSPIQVRFDQNQYEFVFNNYTYIESPVYEQGSTWDGSIYTGNSAVNSALKINGTSHPVLPPFFNEYDDGDLGVAIIPGSWVREAMRPVCLLNIRSNKGSEISLFRREQNITVGQNVKGFVNALDSQDIAIVQDKERFFVVSYNDENKPALALNFWINGRQKFIYPLGEKLFWAYQYAHACDAQHNLARPVNKNEYVTLDFELNQNVGEIVQRYDQAGNRYKSPEFNFSVVGIDGTGAVRLMTDYARNRETLNPNSDEDVRLLEEKYYWFSDSRKERLQWGNLNLLRLQMGPGSSIKPLIAAAVASRVNAGWEHLILLRADNSARHTVQIKGRQVPAVKCYAGLNLPGRRAWTDGHGGFDTNHDFIDYLRSSNNFYHSLIMFLGSYKREDFATEDGNYNIAMQMTTNPEQYADNPSGCRYPAMNLAGHGPLYFYPVNTATQPERVGWPRSHKNAGNYFGNEQSLLSEGVATNLKLWIDTRDKLSKPPGNNNFSHSYFDSIIKDKNRYMAWSFPEVPQFMQASRKASGVYNNFMSGLKNPTLGGTPYQVTPLGMAEAYGSLFMQNNHFKAFINEGHIGNINAWSVHPSWNGGFNTFLSRYIFEGMQQVLISGTARGLNNRNNRFGNYYVYAKTGTIGEGKRDSKRLAVILSTADLAANYDPNARVYVLFFAAQDMDVATPGASDFDWETIREIINQVVNSESFTNYMTL